MAPGQNTGGLRPAPARFHADGGADAPSSPSPAPLPLWRRLPRLAVRGPILVYRYSLSALMGRQCRFLPTCSEYADDAIARHGAWAGGWMVAGRLCRCHPWGGHGFDPVPEAPPPQGRWFTPWRYGTWHSPPQD